MDKSNTGIIPDAQLEAYLADKLTTKPDYPDSVPDIEIISNFGANQIRLESDRKDSNRGVIRSYGLHNKKKT